MRYEDLKSQLQTCPVTWVPALLVVIVQRAVRDRVFQEGGLQKVVENSMLAEKLPVHGGRPMTLREVLESEDVP